MKRLLAALALSVGAAPAAAAEIPVPAVRDPELALSLFAAEPQIVTPVGMTVDGAGRIWVVESHTHMPPAGYAGPKHDRIKVLADTDGDGRADEVTVFADGPFRDAMNLALGPDGTVYVACQSELLALRDTDGDGRADRSVRLLHLDTKMRYSHSGLLGVALSPDGWLYVSRGNIGGFPYTYVAVDGTRLPGYGDGGDIVRLRADGTRLERFATGFWNPFDVKIDGAGRLLAVDNDPDSRGPNRLLHVVRGGDYGYRTRYGESGLHPFSAWTGELPGTLGPIAGTGEAPSGVLDASTAALPASYAGGLLVTVWAESSIERFRPAAAGASLTATREVLIKGSREFRPVAIAAAPDGSVFFSDWVKKDYPNHGLGRIWRLQTKRGVRRLAPRAAHATRPDGGVRRVDRLASLSRAQDHAELRAQLTDGDPFVRAVAVGALARGPFRAPLLADLRHANARVRLGALLALRAAGGAAYPLPAPPAGTIEALLGDADPDVRTMALVWAGEIADPALRPALRRAIDGRPSVRLVRTYLAALDLVTEAERAHLLARRPRSTAGEALSSRAAEPVVRDPKMPAEVRALALPYVDAAVAERSVPFLTTLLRAEHPRLRAEAIRSLALVDARAAVDALVEAARDAKAPAATRIEALGALAARPEALARVRDLASDRDAPAAVRVAAARVLRTAPPEEPARPSTPAAWWAAVRTGGDPTLGRLVFTSPTIACVRCHTVDGRGGSLGPDLSHVASAMPRERLLDSILDPSAEVSPEFQAYVVVTKKGETLTGSQFHYSGTQHFTLRLADGRDIKMRLDEIESHAAADASIMPQGLEAAMAVDELRDLLAFLSTLR